MWWGCKECRYLMNETTWWRIIWILPFEGNFGWRSLGSMWVWHFFHYMFGDLLPMTAIVFFFFFLFGFGKGGLVWFSFSYTASCYLAYFHLVINGVFCVCSLGSQSLTLTVQIISSILFLKFCFCSSTSSLLNNGHLCVDKRWQMVL